MPYAKNNGVHIYSEVEGSGPPLVLHHGLSASRESWRLNGYVERLRNDYMLILMDSRGHGQSDKPHDVEAYALPLRVADVTAVLDDLGLRRSHFLGYPMGGWVGWGLASYASERFWSLAIGAYSATASLEKFGWDMRWVNEANDLTAIAAAANGLTEPGVMELLPAITLPCLLFGGSGDPLFSGAGECARHMPRATVLSLPGLDHVTAYRRPDLVVPRLRKFLAGVEAELLNES